MKTYMFQFATMRGEIFENTDLITIEEAKELWSKNYQKAYDYLNMGVGVQMYIWKDCEDNCDYHDTYITIENDYEAKDGLIYPPPAEPLPISKTL